MSALAHALEYSKSSRAKCNGNPPCKGTLIDLGMLRYGQVVMGEYGEQIKWRHWGCVTPSILGQLAIVDLDRVPGFDSLKYTDKEKIREAVARQRVDPEDIPASAKTPSLPAPVPTQTPTSTQRNGKRKAAGISGSGSSQASSSWHVPTTHRSSGLLPSDVIEIIDDDEDTAEQDAKDDLYCVMKTQVVGVQYYTGMVGPGEQVRLQREPHNKYDRWAVQVMNIAGRQVGHLPRNVVAKLSPLLDRNLIGVEGVMNDGNLRRRVYSMSITLRIYGPADKRDELEPMLVWATSGQRGFPPARADGSRDVPGLSAVPRTYTYSSFADDEFEVPPARKLAPEEAKKLEKQRIELAEAMAKAAELGSILSNLEKVDDENRRGSLLDTLCPVEDAIKLPEHPNPPGPATGELVVNLLKHQSQGLRWCIEKEYPQLPTRESDKPIQFWQLRKTGNRTYYYNLATKTPQEAVPILGRGALCADSMGLGKTLTMLALIIATKNDRPNDCSRSTLIIVPLSLLSNWEGQINEHCTRNALTYHIYYGDGRSVNPSRLKKYDVVITTYQVVTGEHAGGAKTGESGSSKRQKTGGGLFGVKWKRVILDEGHTIRNPKTKMANAVYALDGQRRWILTGTPIINSPTDIGSILTFLQICKPLDTEDFFKRLVLRPLKAGSPEGYQLLRALMNQICLRRTKEMQDKDGKPLVALPGVEMVTIPVKLDPKARELYDTIEDLSKQRVQNLMDDQGSVVVSSNILSMLTRLRQVVLHPGLIPADYVQQMQRLLHEEILDKPGALIKVTPELETRLQAILVQMIEDNEECPICFEVLNDPRITGCAHAFCLECITATIARDARCPMDRRQITMADLVEPAPLGALPEAFSGSDNENPALHTASSAKIGQLVKLLQLTPGNEKSLVFSQFTTFLDKIEEALIEADISYVRFDGKMNAKQREEVLQRFCVPLDDTDEATSTPSSPLPSSIPTRARGNRRKTIVIEDSETEEDDDDEYNDDSRKDDSDDSFLDDDDISSLLKKKGKVKVKANPRTTGFSKTVNFGGPNPRVMLISLKAGSLGLNLTVANNVYLMDPWWQEGIESQAIDRCNRIGQKKTVHVYQLIAENTVESKVIDIQERKKKLINEAFSGIKNATTQRQKREARMQDLIELFGIRQRAASNSQATLDRFRSHN